MAYNSREVKEIHRLLKNAVVTPDAIYKWYNGDKEQLCTILNPIMQYSLHHTPDKLYRMRAVSDNALDALDKDEVYLTRADLFNDPYDSYLTFDAEKMKRSIAEKLSDENMNRVLAERDVRFPMGELFKTKEEYLTFFQTKRGEFIDNCATIFPGVTVELQKNTYVASLTENIASPVMWAHYAKNHTGFALEYQFRKDMFSPQTMTVPNEDYNWYGWRSILPIYYSETRADGTELADWFALCKWFNCFEEQEHKEYDMSRYLPDLLLKTKLCLQKSAEWAYEHEWRLMISHNWPNYLGPKTCHLIYPVSGIYFGEKISRWNKKLLENIAKEKNIPVFQMYMDQSGKEYKMEYRAV